MKRNFETMINDSADSQQPKSYQMDVFKVALERNTIAHLDTGAGKTMTAVMIIKEVALSLKKQPSETKLIIFLTPTRKLVEQQFNVLKENTDLMVDFYHGAKSGNTNGKNVDEWDAEVWKQEINKNQVMVMTPQILLDALKNELINFETICLLIIDECHRASGNHPYATIMKEYYLKAVNKPKVFGMTASLVTKKGISSAGECEAQITELENVLDSLVYRKQNIIELENATPHVSQKYCFYQPAKVDHGELKVKLESTRLKFEVQLLEIQKSNDYSEIIYCIDELGLLCAYEAVKICIANAPKAVENDFSKENCLKCSYFLEEALSLIAECLPNGHENIFDPDCDYENMVAVGYISPKLKELFCLLRSFGETANASCLIIVESCITAKVLDIIVKRMPTKVNLLFATHVAEEGIELPKCSTVIQFDIPKTVTTNFQSQQSGSHLIIMVERGNEKQRELTCDIIQSEFFAKNGAKKQKTETSVGKASNIKETKNLPPNNKENKPSKTAKEPPSGAGTTKRKELHGTTPIRAVSGSWGDKLEGGFNFYAYKIKFTCSIENVKYSSFVLLLESKLDDDVANMELELYLVSKSVTCKVSSCVELHLTAEQVAKGKSFQELFFNGIFGKLYVGSKPREFLLQKGQKLWAPSYMFLLLPLESLEPLKINWPVIDSSAFVIESLKKNSDLRAEKQSTDSIMSDSDAADMVHFANRPVHKNDVKDIVLLAIHSGKIYSGLELLENETANSPFDGDSARFSSFTDYFKKKYQIELVYPEQNLLLLKQSHRAHNLLVDFNGEGILHGKKIRAESCKMNKERRRYNARIPPELLVVIDARIDVVKPFYLLPSLMHRLESLMLASQLREQITGQNTEICISSSLILEAITTLRCNESFSMERLELLGDSVLKYAVSCHLYLQYANKQEGQLSAQRSSQVCNSMLYNLGINCQLQGYIRDSAFDPTRWTAPGQLLLRPSPCDHGVDSPQVPIDPKYQTEDPKIMTGKSCDSGHRWLGSKTISDCVEALVGAYFVGGRLDGGLHCMKWLGIKCELDPSRVNQAIETASLHTYTPKIDVIRVLESKLGYEFGVKGLLLEAITHASGQSGQDQVVGFCYERLEFVGDSVLDLLITWYLYKKHNNIDPGELTDLRSASVNNENFAYAAVRRDLHPHLQHRSPFLQNQIAEYVKFVATSSTDTNSLQTNKSPKALGDLVESIAGAILVDTRLNLDEVWRVFEPLLSPIVTPDKLELPPLRELMELCDSMGYFIKDICCNKGDHVVAELRVQLEDTLLVGIGNGSTRKIARGQAALKLLKDLEKRGISRKKEGPDNKIDDMASNPDTKRNAEITLFDPKAVDETDSKVEILVLKSINRAKGGPRSTLYELCKKMQWPMPNMTPSEHKSKSMVEIGEGVDKRRGFSSFESHISLTIPSYGVIELTGDPRADKKTSFDSAALLMLYKLQQLGMLKIN